MLDQKVQKQLFPKFDFVKGKGKFANSEETKLMSNYYEIDVKKDYKTIYQYSIGFEPELPEDASKIADKLIDSVKKELRVKTGFISFKGRMLWGNLEIKMALIIKTTIEVKSEKQEYEIIIKPAKTITIDEFITKDQSNLIKLSQVLNVNIKNVLRKIGFKQLDRGNYYNDKDFEADQINQAGLSVWRGYQITLVPAASKLYIKVDVCSRVLRLESFLETIKKTGKIQDKNYINETFRQSSVITRYGSHRICRIEEIDYSMTPKSTFFNKKAQSNQSFIEYYRSNYQCTIKDQNQPLIKIIVKNCEKEEIQYLVPQLVCLTGLTDDQRADFNVMKALAQYTKLNVTQRVTETNKIVNILNKEGSSELLFQIDQKAHQFDGNLMGAPMIFMGKNKQIQPNKGQMILRDTLLDPIHLKEYYIVYTSRGDRDDDDADAVYDFLDKASKSYGIRLNKPIFVDIKVNRNQRLSAKDWINEIQKENKNGKPQFVILYFNNQEKKDKQLYDKLKAHLVHKLQLNSQVITKKTLSAGAKGALSKASKILLQINDKMGHPLYKVEKQHPFWGKKSIAIGSLSSSGGPKGAMASFVGTRNNDLTQHWSDFAKIDKKQSISQKTVSTFVSGWLKQYFKTELKKLPDVLIIYRDGLNEKQVGKILQEEVEAIQKTCEEVSQKAKINGWKPQLIYINVNQKTGTRTYEIDRNGRLSNPLPGTIIGSELSKDGSYEFLMASAVTTEGTCNMVQYKVGYDSSKQEVPHDALKIITYEQCYNYPNWAGSIRYPAPLQKATKLAKFVATQGESQIDKSNPLKNLDYYI